MSSRAPLASVLLPTHNRPAWLEQALRSVLEGDFGDFEVIVSNNGDPAHTLRLRERIGDERVRWVEQPPSGMLANFLGALRLARGRYYAVLHDDDWWDHRLLATLVGALEAHPEALVAFGDQWQVNADGEVLHADTEFCTRTSGRGGLAPGLHPAIGDLAARERVPIVGSVFRRDAVSPDDFPAEVGHSLDLWTPYLLARTGGAAYTCRERLVYCRSHAGSDFESERLKFTLAAAYCEQAMLDDPRLAPYHREVSRRLAVRRQWIGATLLRQGSRAPARRHLHAALRLRPTAKGIMALGASWVVPGPLLGRL